MPNFDFMNAQMPQWQQMGDEQQQMGNAVSPFADALKKRMNQPKPSGPFNAPAEPSFSGMLGGSGGVLGSPAPKKGGLMGKSF